MHFHPAAPAEPENNYGAMPDLWICDECGREVEGETLTEKREAAKEFQVQVERGA